MPDRHQMVTGKILIKGTIWTYGNLLFAEQYQAEIGNGRNGNLNSYADLDPTEHASLK